MKPFIVFEGTDGSGTTAHSKALVKRLQQREIPALWTCEPTKTPLGTLIRDIFERKHGDVLPSWRAMTMLFQADREMHAQKILKDIETQIVVSDRYWLSTFVYQSIQAQREAAVNKEREGYLTAKSLVLTLNKDLPIHPDIMFVLDVPPEVAFERKKGAPPDLYENMEMRIATRNEYLAVSLSNVVHINTNCKKEEVWDVVDSEISRLYGF